MSSDLLFNKDGFLVLIKKSFSVRHKWHRLLLLLLAGAVAKILQLIVKLVLLSLGVQICFDSSALFE